MRAVVADTASAQIRDPDTGFLAMGLGPTAADALESVARTRHSLEALIAKQMVAAEIAGSLPHDSVTVVQAAAYTPAEARRLLEAGRFAHRIGRVFPEVWQLWQQGKVATAHVHALSADTEHRSMKVTCDMVRSVLPQLADLTPTMVAKAAARALAAVDPDTAETSEHDEYDRRRLTITQTREGVRVSGLLPKAEGLALQTAVDAMAERQRAEGDSLTARQRRADGLAGVVAAAVDKDRPSRGGLPAAVVMTLSLHEAERIAQREAKTPVNLAAAADDPQAPPLHPAGTIGHRHLLGDGAARFGLCCTDITPIAIQQPASLIARLTDTDIQPLAVGRSQRLATAAQRKALTLRDGGCVIDGCAVPAQECQPHHVHEWSLGGATDLENLALLCWSHHRQVDLNRWRLEQRGGRWHATPTPRHRWRTRPPAAA